jgi:primosomal protein N' (replication factor Y)
MPNSLFVDVILPLALPKLYTYSIPDRLNGNVSPGVRVVVQLGKKKLYSAIVFRVHSIAPEAYQTKDILQVIDDEPLVSEVQLKLWEWMAGYYMCSLGEVMKAALPSGLKMESETLVRTVEEADQSVPLSDSEALILSMMDDGKSLSIQQLVAKASVSNPMGAIKSLLDKGLLSVYESIESSFIPKFEVIVRLHSRLKVDEDINRAFGELKRAQAQQKLLMAFLSITVQTRSTFTGWVTKSELMAKADVSEAAFKAMVAKNIFEVEKREVSRLELQDDDKGDQLILTAEQEKTLQKIADDFKEKQVVLLHGVTSSGKTEMYINLIAEQLRNGKQVLYLLPEIALTAQIINRLKRFFGNRVGIYHSKFSDNQRVEVYQSLMNDGKDQSKPSYDIILGVRSSIFLPFKRLGLVIVDEEHENTFKQFNPAPRYHARDSVILLAAMQQAKVLLGTATPSLESYYNAQVGKYGFATITQRYKDIEPPEIVLVDTLIARKKKLMKSIFSPQLLEAIGETLGRGEQVILFQNRRGYSPFIECEECAWVPQCKHCDVSLTYHKRSNQLVCHYCSYTIPNLSTCLACGSAKLTTKGFGTEKVEDELALFFPSAVIERMDLDTTRSRHSYERIISEFELGKIDVLIGTQMVTKGLDFDRVSLVGILNADNTLNFPDFRAHERSYQLMAQVSGRAGRKFKRGKVYIQTTNPDHPIIKHVVSSSYELLFKEQLLQRKDFHYPPYYRLIRISLKHLNIKTLQVSANQLATNLRSRFKERVLGPEEPLISKIQNLYIEDILIKLERNLPLPKAKTAIQQEISRIQSYKPFGGVIISIDVDPM